MSPALERFADLLERAGRRVVWNGGHSAFKFQCCLHDDHNPSADARVGDRGAPVIASCQVCGPSGKLPLMLEELGATDADRDAILGGERNGQPGATETIHHDYFDRDGKPVLRVVRYLRGGKTVKLLRQYQHGGRWCWPSEVPDGWVKPSTRSLLYNAAVVIEAARRGDTIYLGEGERVADALIALGLPATCNAGGASKDGQHPKWTQAHADQLRGAGALVIFEDNDGPGRAHGQAEATTLAAAAISDLRMVRFPDLPEHADLVDWLRSVPPDQRREAVADLVARATRWVPEAAAARIHGERPEPTEAFHLTEFGNAARLVAAHGGDLRYCHPWRAWLVWDGRRWQRDATAEVVRRAKRVLLDIYAEAATAPTPEARSALAAWAARCEREAQVGAMLALAEAELPVVPDALDADPWCLCVQNGLLNLRTGELAPHRREALATRLAPVRYDPAARSPAWDAFLEQMVPDADVRGFLQRAAGYSLTGDTGEEVLFFIHGPEAAGKSTFTEAVKAALGDYAATCDFETFLRKRGDAGIRNDIARLAGRRMVLSLEVDEGRHLATALVKNLTGRDTISARFLHQEFFEFRPQFKLWLVANARPRANAADGALWRRIHLVPFTTALPEAERKPAVKALLTQDPGVQSAILAWAVAGCLAWQRDGLQAPQAVRQATADYRAECDHLADFLDEVCVLEPGAEITAKTLRERYEGWCKGAGERPVTGKQLGVALRERGAEPYQAPGGTRWWKGIR